MKLETETIAEDCQVFKLREKLKKQTVGEVKDELSKQFPDDSWIRWRSFELLAIAAIKEACER